MASGLRFVVVPPCQEPCCRRKRGESPYPETPKQAGERIANAALDTFRRTMADAARGQGTEPEFARHPYTCADCTHEFPTRRAYEAHFRWLQLPADHPTVAPGQGTEP